MRRYYEFALVVIVLGLLALVLLGALGRARDAMEEAGLQAEVAALRIGLVEVVAHREAFGGALPASANPIDWVADRPVNYLGEQDGRPEGRSVWYFDRQARELVYQFHDGHRARFRLSRDGRADGSKAVIAGVGLLRLKDQR